MFIQNVLALYSRLGNQSEIFNGYHTNYENSQKPIETINVSSKPYLFSILTKNNKEKVAHDIQDFANKTLISRNLAARLINKYWQETIFLSISNPVSDIYINNLKASGIYIHISQYKKFLLDLNKALNLGRIEVSINSTKYPNQNISEYTYIKYIWKKGLNFSLPKHLLSSMDPFQSIFSTNQLNNRFIKILNNNEVPLFTVINRFNEIVMAEPSTEIMNNITLLDKAYQWYYNKFLWTEDHNPVYEGLFFINPGDAFEYKDYIQSKYKAYNTENHLQVLASRLNFYYKISQKRIPKVKFRLIPDLTEIGELLFKYIKLNHVSFHNDQNYGKEYFQGQPIYLIQPTFAIDKKTKKTISIEYDYEVQSSKKQMKYKAIFMNYKTALIAWKQFRQQYKNHILPLNPSILVYNLEDYINKNRNNNIKSFLLIPSKEAYNCIKNNKSYQYKNHLSQIFSSKWLRLQVLTKRIIWSLTSRQPTVW